MSRTDTWMPLHIAAYLADTTHLSTEEHGAYLLLLMDYWRHGPLPNDDRRLARISGIGQWKWNQGGIGRVIREFFAVGEDGRLHQKRQDKERGRVQELSAKRSKAAKGGRGDESGITESFDESAMDQCAETTPGVMGINQVKSMPVGGQLQGRLLGVCEPFARLLQPPLSRDTVHKERKKESPPSPPKGGQRRARGRMPQLPIPDDWYPDAADLAFALEHRQPITLGAINEFKDWHKVTGRLTGSVKASWRTWSRKAIEMGRCTPLPTERSVWLPNKI